MQHQPVVYDKETDCPTLTPSSVPPHPDLPGGNEAVGWEVGLQQGWALSPQPIAQCAFINHLLSLGPGALAYNRSLG